MKGGNAAEVTNETTDIILEIANFDAASVRKTSRSLSLITDASKRFENNLSPLLVESARAKLAGLIYLLAGGTIAASGEQYPAPQLDRAISFTLDDIQRLLGKMIDDSTIVKIFDRYGYTYEKSEDFYTLDVPFWRQDITGAHDIAEEIGRVFGYDKIPVASLPFTPRVIPNEQYEKIRAIKYALVDQGYSEVMTYSFRKKGEVHIAYGPKDKSALRTNLSDALKESYEMNRLNAPLLGLQEIKLFEIGTVFTDKGEQINVAIADKSGVKEWGMEEYVIENPSTSLEIVVPSSHYDIFKPWSPYPFITRDIAVWLTTDEDKKHLQEIIETFARNNCVRPATLFDMFTKDGKTSVAYRFVFQSMNKTLTDAEVETVFQQLVSTITSYSSMTIR